MGLNLKLCLLAFGIFIASSVLHAQEVVEPKVEVFAGAELHYRDIFYGKIYEVLVNVTPGLKWNMGKQWKLAGQAIIPVYNDYGDRYKKIPPEHGGTLEGMGLERKTISESQWWPVR